MEDFTALGLNDRLEATDSIINKQPKTITGYEFDSQFEIQTKRLITSKITIRDFIIASSLSQATASFASGTVFNWSSSLSFNAPSQLRPTFGRPYISAYLGTAIDSDFQFFPQAGGSVTYGQYEFTCFYNYDDWRASVNSYVGGVIVSKVGTSSQTFSIAIQWEYLDYVSGTAV